MLKILDTAIVLLTVVVIGCLLFGRGRKAIELPAAVALAMMVFARLSMQ